MPQLQSITPLIPTGAQTLAQSILFFTEELGFSLLWQAESMASIRRDQIDFLLVDNNNREWADNASFSIGVSELDSLHIEYKNTTARLGALEMKFWGRREFHMVLPSGVCLQFYEK